MSQPEPQKQKVNPALVVFLVIPLLGVVAAVGVLLSGGSLNNTGQATPAPVTIPVMPTQTNWSDRAAPDFTLATLDGATASLSDFRGRVVFLNFWATWCIPCERELPTFEQFMDEQTGDDAPIIVAVNAGETLEKVRDYLAEREIDNFPVLLDPELSVNNRFGVFNLPVTLVIDAQGVVRYPKYGEITLEELYGYVEAVEA